MGARKVRDERPHEEWEFDSYDELAAAAKAQAHVCGDELREGADGLSFEIHNYHQSSIRWKGRLAPQAKSKPHMRNFTVTLTHDELSILQDGKREVDIRDVKNFVIEQILEQVERKE